MRDLNAFVAPHPDSSPVLELLSSLCNGTITVDKAGRIVWLSTKYAKLMSLSNPASVIGKNIEEILPHSQLPRVIKTGQPLLADLMQINEHWCFVSRLPILSHDGDILGAIGFVYFDGLDSLDPLFEKYARVKQHLTQPTSRRSSRYTLNDIIGTSASTQALKRKATRAAQLDTTVLLIGETGTGKELLAQGIHQASHRHQGPFVGINMAALPEALVESELFGTAPGAYTGADRKHKAGKVQLANGGTLFLDEISEMPLSSQGKLLRILQEREVEALGSNQLVHVDVRIIAATSSDLAELVKAGKFRADLYYRINVLPISLPPLRRRTEDIPALCEAFQQQIEQTSGLPKLALSAQAKAWLASYAWPGNIRELRNRLERACVMCEAKEITAADLGDTDNVLSSKLPLEPIAANAELAAEPSSQPVTAPAAQALKLAVTSAEKQAIMEALKQTDGNKSKAAKLLGISRSSFYLRLKKCQL